MTTITKENLDERIERIKKRNEEIEKKYREAEEDRLRALKDNAMVEIKPPKDDKDWPKAHKYDKIDFTYDVKPEKLEELEKHKKEESTIVSKLQRDYKKFADGEGPPPDPAYNFLADAERDGIIISSHKNENRKDLRQINANNNNAGGKNKDYHQQHRQQRGAPNNNSFRGRGGGNKNQKNQNKNSQPEYEQWRNEREKIDEARISRQKIGDGRWKREWDNDKINAENECLLRPEKITLGDAFNNAIGGNKKSPIHNGHNNHNHGGNRGNNGVETNVMNRQNSGHNFNMNAADCLVEKRGNITVSVSQTGEVKSVKLTSAPAIGTGRVGPRQISKPQFSIQTVEREVTIQPPPPKSPHPQHKNLGKNNTINNNYSSNTPYQNVPNKINGGGTGGILTSLNTDLGKIKKDKKHPPKQHQQSTSNNAGDHRHHQALANNHSTKSASPLNVQTTSIGANKQSTIQQKIQISPQQKIQVSPQQKVQQRGHGSKVEIENKSTIVAAPILPISSTTPVTGVKLPASHLSGDEPTSPPSTLIQSSPLSANDIPVVPIVDLSHKPEFQKKSIQDRLLRVRQTNNSNATSASTTVSDSSSVIATDIVSINDDTSKDFITSTPSVVTAATPNIIDSNLDTVTSAINAPVTENSKSLTEESVVNYSNNTEEKIVISEMKQETQACDNKTTEPTAEVLSENVPIASSVETVIACN